MNRKQEEAAENQLAVQAVDKMKAEIARMRADEIHSHWQDWAVRYGADLRATTIASSIKRLEIAALHRAIARTVQPSHGGSLLEVGCGNAQNLVALAKIFSDRPCQWTGIDYVAEMIDAARKNVEAAEVSDRVQLFVGDVLALERIADLKQEYDVVFTDRLVINLDTIEKQLNAINALAGRVSKDGALIMIENSRQTKDAQNDLREALGLPRRKDADFNLFFDDRVILPHLKSSFGTVEVEDFGGLHDIILYALLPHAMRSEFHYDHPIMQSVAELCSRIPIDCGPFGQNRLYYCRR
jgi:SAM-dependent methyltransferase